MIMNDNDQCDDITSFARQKWDCHIADDVIWAFLFLLVGPPASQLIQSKGGGHLAVGLPASTGAAV